MGAVRRDYKSSLFCHLFGDEERKANAAELYNALSGGRVSAEELELTTIGDAVFLGRKNDVSFLVGNDMVLWEHQSTHNPNMPLRGLHYFSRLYAKLVERRGLDIYSSSLLALPTPRYVVLYFGEADRPDREVLRLSDSFAAGPGDLEVTVTALNCNEGRNGRIMRACEALRGYSRLVGLSRRNRREKGMPLDGAVRSAVSQCIDEGVLAGYLAEHRAEVEEMLFTIQDEERAMRVHREAVERAARESGYRDGREQGLRDGREQGLRDGREQGWREALGASVSALMASAGCDAEAAMDMLGVPDSQRPALRGGGLG